MLLAPFSSCCCYEFWLPPATAEAFAATAAGPPGFHGEKKWNRNISPTIQWDIWLVSSIDWLGNQFKMDISIGKSLSSMKDFPASHVWLAGYRKYLGLWQSLSVILIWCNMYISGNSTSIIWLVPKYVHQMRLLLEMLTKFCHMGGDFNLQR